MERLVIVAVVALVAVVVAVIVQRRTPPTTPAPTGAYRVPRQLHRRDFADPDAEWLVVVFTSATCAACAGVWDKARHLGSDSVAVDEVEFEHRRDLHDRYGIDAVPTTLITDADGVVRASFIGPVTATDLWAAVAELREPGSVPSSCETHLHDADS